MLSTLETVLDRAECDPPLFFADEIVHWPDGLVDRFVEDAVLQPTTPATVVPCLGCGDHVEQVVFLGDADGMRAFVPCPQCGPVRVDPADLRRWELNCEGLLRVIARDLGCCGPPWEIVPGRMWRVGHARLGGHRRDVYFGRRLAGREGHDSLHRAGVSAGSVVFAAGRIHRGVRNRGPIILPLGSILNHTAGHLTLDRQYVEDRLGECAASRLRKKAIPKRAERARLIAALTGEMMEHLRSARDYALDSEARTGDPKLLPRPLQADLAKRTKTTQTAVSRCLKDPSARELRCLWKMAVDLDQIRRV